MIQIIIDGNEKNGDPVHEVFDQDELEEVIEFLMQLKEREEDTQ
jgi:cytochrome c1